LCTQANITKAIQCGQANTLGIGTVWMWDRTEILSVSFLAAFEIVLSWFR